MQYVQLGEADLKVSRIILGTWALGGWMWGGTEGNDAQRAVDASIDRGITTIDTAPMYGFGLSEELIGKAIQGRRSQVQIATKFCLRWDVDQGEYFFQTTNDEGTPLTVRKWAGRASIFEECDRSLKRLGIDEIDLYQCHWPDATTPKEEMMEALLDLKARGKIRAFGVSNFDVPMLRDCMNVAKPHSLQPPYSLLARGIESDILPFCEKHTIGIICYSPMYRGLLTGKFSAEHGFEEGDTRAHDRWFKGADLDRVNAIIESVMQPIAEAHDANPAQVAVAWVLAQPGVTAAIVGARNDRQAAANAQAGEIELPADEVAALTAAFDELLAAKP